MMPLPSTTYVSTSACIDINQLSLKGSSSMRAMSVIFNISMGKVEGCFHVMLGCPGRTTKETDLSSEQTSSPIHKNHLRAVNLSSAMMASNQTRLLKRWRTLFSYIG